MKIDGEVINGKAKEIVNYIREEYVPNETLIVQIQKCRQTKDKKMKFKMTNKCPKCSANLDVVTEPNEQPHYVCIWCDLKFDNELKEINSNEMV